MKTPEPPPHDYLAEVSELTNEGVISTAASRATVRVIHTDEKVMIAETVCRVLGFGMAGEEKNPDQASK